MDEFERSTQVKLDKKTIYRRSHWQPHIAFAWCEEENGWRYIDVDETVLQKKPVFKESYHSINTGYSKVGPAALHSNNVQIYTELMKYVDHRVNIVLRKVKQKKIRGFIKRMNHKLKEKNNDIGTGTRHN